MTAASTIDGGPEPRTIHHRILDYVQYTNHIFFNHEFHELHEFGLRID